MTGWYLFSFLLIISLRLRLTRTLDSPGFSMQKLWNESRRSPGTRLEWGICSRTHFVFHMRWWDHRFDDHEIIGMIEWYTSLRAPSHENSDGFLKSFPIPTLFVLSRHIMRFLVKGSTIWWSFMIVVIVEWKKHWGSEVELVYFHNMPCVSLWGGLFLCNCLFHCRHKKFSNG